jgi:hypothetical protein
MDETEAEMARKVFGLVLASAVIAVASGAVAATITSIDRPATDGTIVSLDSQGRLMVKTEEVDEPIGIALDGVEEVLFSARPISSPSSEAAPFRLTLTDGMVLHGSILAGTKPDTFRFRTTTVGTLDVSLEAVARIESRSEVRAALDLPPSAEELGSRIEEFKAYFARGGPGICDLVEINEKGVRLYFPGLTADFDSAPLTDWSRMRTLVRKASRVQEPATLFGIFTAENGDVLRGRVSAWSEDRVKLTTSHNGEVEVPARHLLSAIFKNGRFVYLSDLDPSGVEEFPYFRSPEFRPEDHLFTWRRDRAQGGGPLTMDGRRYSKGLGVHSISTLKFRTDRRYTSFSAVVGIDDSAHELGSVTFKVLLDGKPAKLKIIRDGSEPTTADDTGVLRARGKPVRIEVELAGVSEVTLIVEAADNGDVGDRANWANAKFVR